MCAKYRLVMNAWLHIHSLSECEKEVVEILVSHFEKDTPFLYPSSHEQLGNHDLKTLQSVRAT